MSETPVPQPPLVSVIMPALNEEKHIAAAVASVLSQTHPRLEVFVVDGASTDATAELVRQIAQEDPRVWLISNPDRTIPHALNLGLHLATGEYLMRCDAHARLSDDYIETALRELDAHPGAATVGGLRVGVASTPTGQAIAAALSSRFGVGDSVNHYATQAMDTDHASFAVTRIRCAHQVGGWDATLPVNEDVDFDHRLIEAGYRIRLQPQMKVFWQMRESLLEFGHQYLRYGRGKAAMVRKNGRSAVRWRHLVPPALIANLALAAAVLPWFPLVALGLLLPYLAVLALATARLIAGGASSSDSSGAAAGSGGSDSSRISRRWWRFPAALATMHIAWGWGFLQGLIFGSAPAQTSALPEHASQKH